MLQQFYKCDSSALLTIVAVKIYDDVRFAGPKCVLQDSIAKIEKQYKLGTVVYGPRSFLYYGLQISQDSDYTITAIADAKLDILEGYPITRQRRKQ